MYYPCCENKGADQLRGYREADLRLCSRICKNPVFSRCGSSNTASNKTIVSHADSTKQTVLEGAYNGFTYVNLMLVETYCLIFLWDLCIETSHYSNGKFNLTTACFACDLGIDKVLFA